MVANKSLRAITQCISGEGYSVRLIFSTSAIPDTTKTGARCWCRQSACIWSSELCVTPGISPQPRNRRCEVDDPQCGGKADGRWPSFHDAEVVRIHRGNHKILRDLEQR